MERLVRFALGTKDVGHVAVNVKNSSNAYRGRAYPRIPGASPRRGAAGKYLVIIAIGAPEKYPRDRVQYPGLKTAPVYELRDWREALVAVAAHELQHAAQFRGKFPRSEIDAERAAVRALNRYRESLGESPSMEERE